jgi:hypothetical protein
VTAATEAIDRLAVPERRDGSVTAAGGSTGRAGFAVIALCAAALGGAAMLVPAGPVRLGLLLAFLTVGPGAAVVSFLRTDRIVSWALAATGSLTVTVGVAAGMLWTHAWRPTVAVQALVATVGAVAVVRIVQLGPRALWRGGRRAAAGRIAPFRPARAGGVVPVVLLAGSVAAWLYALSRFRDAGVGGYGLSVALGPWFFLAVGLLGLAFALELFGRARIGVLSAGVVAAATMMHATVPVLYRTIEYAWTYKHIGVIDLIRDNGRVFDNTDIYQQWPGFFAAMAMVSGAAGVDAIRFATWSALTFTLLNALLLAALLRQFTPNRRVITLGTLLFVICCWVDIGYFSPQAYVYTMMLGFWLIVVKWLIPPAPEAREGAGRIARARAAVLRGLPVASESTRRTRLLAALAATMVFTGIVVTHQLTPVLILVPAGVLAVAGLLRPRTFVLVLGVILVGFVAPRILTVASEYALFSFNPVANASGNNAAWGTPEQEFSALVVRILTFSLWLAAGYTVIRSRKRLGAVLLPAVIGFAPAASLVAGNYGGEAIYRVFAFSLPFAALLTAGIWVNARVPGRKGAVAAAASGVAIAAAMLAALQGLQGQVVVNRVPAADIAAAKYFYTHAQPGSMLVLVAPNFPTKLTANYDSFNRGQPVDVALVRDPELAGYLDGTRMEVMEQYIRNLGARDNYLVVSTQTTAYTTYFGLLPSGTTQSLERALRSSPDWEPFYSGDGVSIFHLIPVE